MNAIPIRQQQQQQQNKLRQQQQLQQKYTQLGAKTEISLYATTASSLSSPSSSKTFPGRNKTISNGNSPWEVKRKRMFARATACVQYVRVNKPICVSVFSYVVSKAFIGLCQPFVEKCMCWVEYGQIHLLAYVNMLTYSPWLSEQGSLFYEPMR